MKLLREPLVQFLIIGAALFGFWHLRGGSEGEIVVDSGKVRQLTEQFRTVWMRPPTREELQGLINDYVREEVFYREAVAMGLDRDDQVIRQRMMNKLQLVSEDLLPGAEPSDSELVAWMGAHPDAVRREPIITFSQVYVAVDGRGPEAARKEADRILTLLRDDGGATGFEELGDRTMLEYDYHRLERRDVALKFGDDSAAAIDSIRVGQWSGPIASGYGLHLVMIRERTPGVIPPLAEVRDVVLREVQNERRAQGMTALYERLKEKYAVTVQWPADTAGVRP